MATYDFAKDQWAKVMETGEEIRMGSFQVREDLELNDIMIGLIVNGGLPTTEEIRVNIYSDENYTSLIYQSDWSALIGINSTGNYWIGAVRTYFNRENLNKELIYYHTIEARNYNYTNSYELAFRYDFPFAIYDNGEDLFYRHPLSTSIQGYK